MTVGQKRIGKMTISLMLIHLMATVLESNGRNDSRLDIHLPNAKRPQVNLRNDSWSKTHWLNDNEPNVNSPNGNLSLVEWAK